MKTLRILHFADLHADSPLGNLSPALASRIQEEQKNFIRSLSALCREQKADVLIIAGDLFDNPYPSRSLADFVADSLAQIRDTDIYILPGNHDPFVPESVWLTTRWPDHVHIFTDNIQKFENNTPGLCIEGAAYTGYHADEPLFQPDGTSFDGFRILVWHGDITTGKTRYNPLHPGSPFLAAYDYIAMGHVHNPENLPVLPAYPGFVLGRGYDELGQGGVTLATLQKGKTETKMIPVDGPRFEVVEADITGGESLEEVLEIIDTVLAGHAGDTELESWMAQTALRLILTGKRAEDVDLNLAIIESRLLDRKPLDLGLFDHTRVAVDMEEVALESGLRGIMARNLLERQKQTGESEKIARAFDLLIRAERKEPFFYEDS